MAASSVNADTAFLHRLHVGSESFGLDSPRLIAATLLALIIVPIVASSVLGGSKRSKIPVANPPRFFETVAQKQAEFAKDAARILSETRKRFGGKPYILLTNRGPWVILPPERAQEIRNIPQLSFRLMLADTTFEWMAGLRTVKVLGHPNEGVLKIINKHLTKRLNTVTEPLALETAFAVKTGLGDNSEWTEVKIYNVVLDIVARLSSRVFLGPDICRNEEWLDITKNYALVAIKSVKVLQGYPNVLKPLVYFTHPFCRTAQQQYKRASKIITPVVKQRSKERQEFIAKGLAPPIYNDAIAWAEAELAGDPFTPADVQLFFSGAAIHTTSDLLTQTLLQLSANPAYIPPLREEIVQVLGAAGWKKTALTNLKLLDSAIKEAQRVKPLHMTGMQRKVLSDIELEGGISLRKGQIAAVDSYNMSNPAVYENPEKYDPYRFFELRKQPGGEYKNSLVSTAPEHLAFGYGRHACPGRFFAANEIKIALCHLLLKYDWKLAPGETTEPTALGIDVLVNPAVRLMYKRRKEELDLDALEVDRE